MAAPCSRSLTPHGTKLHRDVQTPWLPLLTLRPRAVGRQMECTCIPQWSSASSLCGTAPAWAAGAQHNLQHLEARNPTSNSTKKVSHSETMEYPQHFLPFCLLDSSSLCSRRLFLIPHCIPESHCHEMGTSSLKAAYGRRQPQQRPEEGRHHLQLLQRGFFPEKQQGCALPHLTSPASGCCETPHLFQLIWRQIKIGARK